MVLDADRLDALTLERVPRREVVRMEIVGDDCRLDREQALEVRHPVGERAQRLVVAQIADVVSHPGAGGLGEAERVLQLGTAGEHRALGRDREGEASWHVAARAANEQRRGRGLGGDGPDDRVVGARVDRAVVDAERVRRFRRAARAPRRRGTRSARRRRCPRSSRASPRCRRAEGDEAASRAASLRDRRTAGDPAATGAPGLRRAITIGRAGPPRAAPARAGRARPARGPRRRRAPSARTAGPRGAFAFAAPSPRAGPPPRTPGDSRRAP